MRKDLLLASFAGFNVKPWSSRTLHSEKNGTVVVKRWFGKPEIEVDGFVQSGEYMRCLWSEALWRARSSSVAESILMLGLGCGSAVSVLLNRFPGCNVTVVEWDPIMIKLSKQLAWYSPTANVKIVCGDAFQLLPRMKQRFDLVLSDLFRGDVLESRLTSPSMICSIGQVMTPTGQLIVNAFKNGEVFDAFANHLDFVQHWQFRNNQLGLFQLFIPHVKANSTAGLAR